MRRRALDYAVYVAVRMVLAILQAMPLELCERLADAVGWLAGDVLKVRGRVVQENLRRAFPLAPDQELRRLTRGMWRHLVLMICEMTQAPRRIHETNWRQFITLQNARLMTRQLLNQRPTLLVSGHYGNFELGGYIAGLLGFPTYTIARPLDNRHLDAWIRRFRETRGQFLLPKAGSAPVVEAILRDGGSLAVLGDQDAGPKGCFVDFLGTPASCHKALALFCLANQAPMAVMFARRLAPLRFHMGVHAILDPRLESEAAANVAALTRWYNRQLEEIILAEPSQYWWLHRRWKTAPKPRKGARATQPAADNRSCRVA